MPSYKSDNMERLKVLSNDLHFPVSNEDCIEKICITAEKISMMLEKTRINKKAIQSELNSLVLELKRIINHNG